MVDFLSWLDCMFNGPRPYSLPSTTMRSISYSPGTATTATTSPSSPAMRDVPDILTKAQNERNGTVNIMTQQSGRATDDQNANVSDPKGKRRVEPSSPEVSKVLLL
jgi:hypothetical protein